MTSWQLGSLARAARADIKGMAEHRVASDIDVTQVSTDTRTLTAGSLFVALRGDRFDGHRFVQTAVRAGACAVLVDEQGWKDLAEEDLGQDLPLLVVEDTLQALGDIAHYQRQEHPGFVVAITGSNGKTTTKEYCAAALGEGVHRTAGNFNNLIGVPLTIFSWPQSATRGCVLEMGMNVPGEIERLTEIAQPDVAIITNVAGAHLEGLGSIDGVAKAKGELFAGLMQNATAIVNRDDAKVMEICVGLLPKGQKQISIGWHEDAQVKIKSAQESEHGLHVVLEVEGQDLPIQLSQHGAHHAYAAAIAIATVKALGEDIHEAARRLAHVQLPGGRMRVVRAKPAGKPVVNLIDDTYNANPTSMAASMKTLVALGQGSNPSSQSAPSTLAVLGEMFELGPESLVLHRQVGEGAASLGVTKVFALGRADQGVAPAAQAYMEGALAKGGQGQAFADLAGLLKALDAELRAGDWVLIKGSRGMRMERVVEHLEGKVAS